MKFSGLMNELMDGLGKSREGLRGKEKFCITLNFPGLPSLGIMVMGKD